MKRTLCRLPCAKLPAIHWFVSGKHGTNILARASR